MEFDLSNSHMVTMGYRQLLVFVKSLSTCDQSLIETEAWRDHHAMLCYRPYIHVGELHGCSSNSSIQHELYSVGFMARYTVLPLI